MILYLLLLFITSLFWAGSQSSFVYELRPWNEGECSRLITRREWRTMRTEERASWIASVKCLTMLRHQRLSFAAHGTVITGTHSLYDDFSFGHSEMDNIAHRNSYFLAWHRWVLHLFDTRLRDTCGYTGPSPFWDWSLDVADLTASPVFDSDMIHGLGGSGDCTSSPESDCLVLNGAFGLMSNSAPILAYPIPHTLRRNLSLYENLNDCPRNTSLSPSHIANITQRTTPGDFLGFQHELEEIHNQLHNFVGGDLAGTCPKGFKPEGKDRCDPLFTPNDPLFWLHHAQLDRLWSNWQNMHPENYYALSGVALHSTDHSELNASHILEFDRLSVNITVERVFNYSAPPLCYYYKDMNTANVN